MIKCISFLSYHTFSHGTEFKLLLVIRSTTLRILHQHTATKMSSDNSSAVISYFLTVTIFIYWAEIWDRNNVTAHPYPPPALIRCESLCWCCRVCWWTPWSCQSPASSPRTPTVRICPPVCFTFTHTWNPLCCKLHGSTNNLGHSDLVFWHNCSLKDVTQCLPTKHSWYSYIAIAFIYTKGTSVFQTSRRAKCPIIHTLPPCAAKQDWLLKASENKHVGLVLWTPSFCYGWSFE